MALLRSELADPIPFDDLLPIFRHEVRQSNLSLDAKRRAWLEKTLSLLRVRSVLVLLRRPSNILHRISSLLGTMGLRGTQFSETQIVLRFFLFLHQRYQLVSYGMLGVVSMSRSCSA